MVGLLLAAQDAGTSILSYVLAIAIIIGIIGWCLRHIISPFIGAGGRCPACGKGIKAGSYVCHHCGRDKRVTG